MVTGVTETAPGKQTAPSDDARDRTRWDQEIGRFRLIRLEPAELEVEIRVTHTAEGLLGK